MDKQQLMQRLLQDQEQLTKKGHIEEQGLDHLIKYLAMKDDKDFLTLGRDVEALLRGLLALSDDEQRIATALGLTSLGKALLAFEQVIKRLDESMRQDLRLIQTEKHAHIDVKKLQQQKNLLHELLNETINAVPQG